jgi:hypothetical protein
MDRSVSSHLRTVPHIRANLVPTSVDVLFQYYSLELQSNVGLSNLPIWKESIDTQTFTFQDDVKIFKI